MKNKMDKNTHNKATRQKLAIIFTAITTVAVAILLAVVLATHVDPKLSRIEIDSLPYRTEYIEKQTLDTSGLKVKAYYGDKAIVITDYTIDKTVLEYGDDTVTVTYTDGGITKTASFAVSVSLKSIVAIEVTKLPNKTVYIEGSIFDPVGTEITAHYDNGESLVINGWAFDAGKPLTASDKSVVVAFEGKTTDIPIEVEKKLLSGIYFESLPYKLKYTEGEYFDFYGLEVYATYENAAAEAVVGWDYDKKERLQTSDSSVEISYSLNDITKSFLVSITVSESPIEDVDKVRIDGLIDILPSIDELSVEHLSSIGYVLSVLNNELDLSSEQIEYKEKLEEKYREIKDTVPTSPEPEYTITYDIAHGLEFSDIEYGNNPAIYKSSDGSIELSAAQSVVAYEQGYEFVGWLVDGRSVTHLDNITADTTVYASFVMTPTVNISFKEYASGEVLLLSNNIARVKEYDFEANGVTSLIYSNKRLLPVAYYSHDKARLTTVDLTAGREVVVYVAAVAARELHLATDDSASVGWTYDYTVDSDISRAEKSPSMGTVFIAPIGATVTITSIHANIDDILLDGVSSGEKVNNSTVKAEFLLSDGEFAVSVTFKTVLADMTTLSFIGYNSHSVIYPSGWDGYIAAVDMNTIAFIYDENSEHYLVTYTIDGAVYYFEDLAEHKFESDTQIWVERINNYFSVTINYANGTETIDGLRGKQPLSSALERLDEEALEVFSAIITDGRIYVDAEMTVEITPTELLSSKLRSNIMLYSAWERKIELPSPPDYGKADYEEYNFVNMWSSQFMYDGDILSSELYLSSDGTYSYKTKINGALSIDASGIYRLEDGDIVVKTVVTDREHALITIDDIKIDITFVGDGLMIASFVDLRGTSKNVFDHTLTCGDVKIVNYTGREFIGKYEYEDVVISLRENGTAIVYRGEKENFAYYRVTESNDLYIFINGILNTGIINDLIGENE